MAFTTASEITFVNQVLDRIEAAQITLADQTSVEALAAFRHWSTTLNSLIRSFEWPFITDRTELVQIETLTVDSSPAPAAWVAGATLTGGTSGTTATVLSATSTTVYVVAYTSGDWTDGEVITDGTNSIDCASGYPTDSSTTPTFEWDYQYELPTDFSRLISVYEDDGTDQIDERWVREGNRILTNYTTCNIRYVKTITDPDDFDPLFREVLLLRLALKLIPPLAGSMSKADREDIQKELQSVEIKARTISAQENNQTGRSDLNLARYGN